MNKIIKNTLVQLKNKGLLATPDNFFVEFSIQSKLKNKKVYECDLFEEIIGKLTPNEQQQVKKENINTFSELCLLLMQQTDSLKGFAYILNEILAPSIQYDIEDDIDKLSINISKDPKKLLSRDTITQIKNITKRRIDNDRKVVRKKAEDVIKLTSLMGTYFDKTLIESGNSSEEIANIKKDLEDLNISDYSNRELGVLQSKLVDTVYNLENSMEKSKVQLLSNKSQFNELHDTIISLQKELESVNEEKDLDYLTNVLNRRALDKEIVKIDKKHKMFGTNYAVIFYDIDYFKAINDTYGHDCGDAVLRTFAGILKKLTRKEDVLARYGGEEFIILLNYDKENEIIKYLTRVKSLIKNSEFKYKEDSITVEFSAGLSFRNKYDTYFEALASADDLLYKAKNSGRDKIVMDNGIEL